MADEKKTGKGGAKVEDAGLPGDEPIYAPEWKNAGHDEKSRFIKEFRSRMASSYTFWADNHRAARADVDFAYNEQWSPEVRSARGERPCLTLNQIPQYINHVVGTARQSKFSIQVKRKGGVDVRAPLVGEDRTLPYHEIMSGVIRDIEQRSKAPMAYARALQHAVEGGFGWLHARLTRPADDPRYVDVLIEHVADRWSVFFDPMAERPDLTDARWAGISRKMPAAEFKARYPDIPAGNTGLGWGSEFGDDFENWWGDEGSVRVTDYYHKVPVRRTVVSLINEETQEDVWGYAKELEPFMDELHEIGFRVVSEEKRTVDQLMWSRMTGSHVLEGPKEYPSVNIPLVPVFGRQVDMDGKRYYISLTRYAMDPQRMYNKWASAATERAGQVPTSPYIASEDQIAGYEDDWRNALTSPTAVLIYKDNENQNPPQRQRPADMPAAEMQMLAMARQAIMDTTGVHEADRGQKSNETSGTAIMRRQAAGQKGYYEFIDNLAHSVSVMGDVLCQMIPRVYKDDRLHTIVLPDDTTARVSLNNTIIDRQSGRTYNIGAFRLARYHCLASAGPVIETEREKLIEMLLEWGKNSPEMMSMAWDKVFENMDAPGARALAERAKKLIPRHLLSQEEQESMPPPEPTPEQQSEMAKHESVIKRAEADVIVAQEQTAQQELKTREAEAEAQLKATDAATGRYAQSGEGMDEGKIERVVRKVLAEEKTKERQAAG